MDAEQEKIAFDKVVRFHVYDYVMREGLPPTIAETSFALSKPLNQVRDSLQRLADEHILVLQKQSGEILMANPFSSVPTAFLVKVENRSYYGNCIWDAMGIPAMLKQNATVEASCGCCSTAMNLKITNGLLEETRGIAHFALPAAHWWNDIVFT
jgi:hypothetical protein